MNAHDAGMNTHGSPLLQVSGLTVHEAASTLLQNVAFTLARGELLGVIGPNGAGKSTLLRCLAGTVPAQQGQLLLQGHSLAAMQIGQRARQLAWLEQRPQLHWPLRVEQVVALGRLPWRNLAADSANDLAVQRALTRCGLQALRERDCLLLSEGEKLLVNLARVLATEASVLLADEPTAALDPRQQLRVTALLQEEAAAGKGVLAVLHDLTLAARHCSRLLLLRAGRVLACGTVEQVLTPALLAEAYGVQAAYDPHLRTVIIDGTL